MRHFLSVLIFVFSVAALSAQTYPDYDGVYVFDEEKSAWIEVTLQRVGPVGFAQSTNSEKDPRFTSNDAVGAYSLTGVLSTPETVAKISRSNKVRLYIRGRNPELSAIGYLVDTNEMSATVPPGDSKFRGGVLPPGAVFDGIAGGPTSANYVFMKNGRPAEEFRSRIVDAYSTEYALDPWKDFALTGFQGCSDCSLQIKGFVVLVPGYMLGFEAQSAYVVLLK